MNSEDFLWTFCVLLQLYVYRLSTSIILTRLNVVQKKLFGRTANLVHIFFRFLFTLNTYRGEQYLLKRNHYERRHKLYTI